MWIFVVTLLFIRTLSAMPYAEVRISQRPNPLPAVISGFVADPEDGYIPGAKVSIVGKKNALKSSTVTDENGRFTFANLDPQNVYRLTITATGFAEWDSPDIILQPGQHLDLDDISMKLSGAKPNTTSVFAGHVAMTAASIRQSASHRYCPALHWNTDILDEHDAPVPRQWLSQCQGDGLS